MIADLVVTMAIYRSGNLYLAICPEFEIEARGASPDDAKDEALAAVGRLLEEVAARSGLEEFLAGAGFVVDGGALRSEQRFVGVEEGRLTVRL